MLIELTSNGIMNWLNTHEGSRYDVANSIIEMENGNLMLAGKISGNASILIVDGSLLP